MAGEGNDQETGEGAEGAVDQIEEGFGDAELDVRAEETVGSEFADFPEEGDGATGRKGQEGMGEGCQRAETGSKEMDDLVEKTGDR